MIYFLFLLAGQEAVVDNAHLVINCLTGLIAYPHMMVPDFFLQKKIKFTLLLTYPLSSLLHLFKLTLFLYKLFFFFTQTSASFLFALYFIPACCSPMHTTIIWRKGREGERIWEGGKRGGGGWGCGLDGSNRCYIRSTYTFLLLVVK